MTEKNTGKTAGSGCPVCDKPVEEQYKPFCSKRCADLDLGKWLNESYAIPAAEPPEYLEDLEDEEEF
ncbi:DNA gyrase inhibitor YacG [Thalassospira lucentensis]|mgnify:FL=1|uniref:DNA gyrase inhibitor YacG n=1 Tax=Thalassospira lucentensis TaxID=168935 RepID=UPI003D268D98|tara:strand:+ start:49913 stop:50113 length:201 start_codon:yes stop_codon:yes gene_type:complete